MFSFQVESAETGDMYLVRLEEQEMRLAATNLVLLFTAHFLYIVLFVILHVIYTPVCVI